MPLYCSAVIARRRDSGGVAVLAQVVNLTLGHDSVGDVLKKHAEIVADAGGDLRAEFSHVLVLVDNHERHSYEFPDAKATAAERAGNKRRAEEHARRQDLARLAELEVEARKILARVGPRATADRLDAAGLALAAAASGAIPAEPLAPAAPPTETGAPGTLPAPAGPDAAKAPVGPVATSGAVAPLTVADAPAPATTAGPVVADKPDAAPTEAAAPSLASAAAPGKTGQPKKPGK